MPFRIREYDAVPTTNGIIKAAIRDAQPEGLVASAFKQTQGYGRQGRAWVSPYGGMYASFLLRPQVPAEHLSTIALVIALAVRDAISGLCAQNGASAENVQVKWPNDVVCPQGKLCGISSELHRGALCVGVGVNVFAPRGQLEVSGKNTPAYVADLLGVERQVAADDGLTDFERGLVRDVRDRLVAALEVRYAQWLEGGFASCADDFRSCMALLGRVVEITTRDGALMAKGRVAGVGDDGLLLLNDADTVRAVASGEAHIAAIGE